MTPRTPEGENAPDLGEYSVIMVESSLLEILVQAETRLRLGDPEPAVLNYAVATEAGLKTLLGREMDSGDMLGELIGAAGRTHALEAEITRALNRLNRWRKAITHHPRVEADCPSVDDAAMCREMVHHLLLHVGLVDATCLQNIRRKGREAAVGVPTEDTLLLDRVPQRAGLEALLTPPPHVLVLTLDGEMEQGHDAFSRYALSEFRRRLPGRWREVVLSWPPDGAGPSNRLARLLEAVAAALAPRVRLPNTDPLGEDRAVWDARLDDLRKAALAGDDPLFVRHVIRAPVPEDSELMAAYLERAWSPCARVLDPGRIVLAFELVRAVPQGLPVLGLGWRVSRRERSAACRVIRTVPSA